MRLDFSDDELLEVPQIAHYLRVSDVTIYRWCREGRLPCLKLGNTWRIRRSALEDFLARGEHSVTLVGQLRSFYRVPDNVLASAQSAKMLHQLDAAFLRVGEARGGMLVKFLGAETGASGAELRSDWKSAGLEVERLEAEGRLAFVAEHKDKITRRRYGATARRQPRQGGPSGYRLTGRWSGPRGSAQAPAQAH